MSRLMPALPITPRQFPGSTRTRTRWTLRTAPPFICAVIWTAFAIGLGLSPAGVATKAQEGTPTVASSIGLTRADPVPLGGAVQAGPVELRVLDVLSGPEAVASVLAASSTNVEPREGTTYVAVSLSARNTGSQPLWLDNDDFAVTGDSGLVWRFLGARPPDQALEATLNPGETTEGWVAFGIPLEERSLL